MSSTQTPTGALRRNWRGRTLQVFGSLLRALFTLWAACTLTFFVFNVLPADPARLVAGPQARPEDVARIRRELQTDRPVIVRYAAFMGRIVHVGPTSTSDTHATCSNWGPAHLDLGRSYTQRRAVLKVLGERLPRTLLLATIALLLQLSLGTLLGIWAAYRPRSIPVRILEQASLLGVSVPTFLIGLGLQYVFAHLLRWLPLDGYGDTPTKQIVSVVLPACTLAIYGFAYYMRVARDELRRQLLADFVRTARAKGASEWRAVVVHALRATLAVLVTLAALDFAALLAGAAVTESLFRYPGLGQLSTSALADRDAPILLGCVLLAAAAVVVATRVAGALSAWFDPRTRTGDAGH
jgi:peptide/nickel transport system permease protein